MINKKKEFIDGISRLSLESNKKKFVIYNKNDEVIWSFNSKSGDNTFIIPIEDYELYESFLKLYSDISNGKIFSEDEINDLYDGMTYNSALFDINSEVINTLEYNELFHDGIITFEDADFCDRVIITKGEDYFKLDFNSNKITNCKKIKFKKSSFKNFSCSSPFIRLSHELQKLDFEFHQMNFYEFSI